MKRCWKLSEFSRYEYIIQKCRGKTTCHGIRNNKPSIKPTLPAQFIWECANQSTSGGSSKTTFSNIISHFSDNCSYSSAETAPYTDMKKQVSVLLEEILRRGDQVEEMEKVLEDKGASLFRMYSNGSAAVELLSRLNHLPSLALSIFEWRRKQMDYASPMTVKEYSKGIAIAGRLKNIVLAVEFFEEASIKQLKETSLFNALMSAYIYNGLAMRCQSVFRELKMEPKCTPSIVTYNILISAFGRLILVDHMEATLREINNLNLSPTIKTYKNLISGYITAWMWEEMEKTYQIMETGPVKPNLKIHLLMLRGYAISGKLEKMEQMYEMVRGHVVHKEIALIRIMISAYCKSADASRVEKVEELLKLIPENEYRSWLNVKLICLYANHDLLERMESSINEAFDRKAYVTTVSVMRCIISSYFRQNAVDKLAEFVYRAEDAGWKICRSLYHCKMVMYASQMRLSEMEGVIGEMSKINMQCSGKTLWILFKAYEKNHQRNKLVQVVGMMCKHGLRVPLTLAS